MDERVPSESDERTRNNTMRHQYRVLSEAEKEQMLAVKDAGQAFLDLLNDIPTNTELAFGIKGSRELSLARTKIEEAVMWAVKHITS